MIKEIIRTDKSPKAIGPYSQAVKTANLLFISGQLPLSPISGEIPPGIKAQTGQALENLKAILLAAGVSLEAVVKTTVFLKNLDDFQAMNEVYQTHFDSDPPARSTVQVARIPRDALIEIEAVSVLEK